ncbi:MAG: rhomboid family intramembrane serine protease [Bosea sp.]|jgi:membrane associated rhomboid family serine protease|nr:rhomboid family intramembrane serine protease [Bosea sp. (in: a-proteobacteria)]
MFLPLYDGVPMRNLASPVVTWAIIGLCVLIHAAAFTGALPPVEPLLAVGFGIIPKVVLGGAYLPEDIAQAPGWLTPLTSLFLHGNLMHLAGNMLFLWVFGDNVEDSMGHWRFLAFFLLCGVMAAFGHALSHPDSVQPLIGASGAISGIIAAYLLLHPRVRVWGLVFKYLPIAVPAWVAIGAWIAVQVLQGFFGGESAIAWFAHLGGLAAGVLLAPLFIRRDISIRQRWAR